MDENTGEMPTPEQAIAALDDSRRRERAAVNAAFDTPWWYFASLSGALITCGGLIALSEPIGESYGFPLEVSTVFAAIIAFAAIFGIVVRKVTQRQTAAARPTYATKREGWAYVGGAIFVALSVYLGAKIAFDSNFVAMSLLAVVIAVGGVPFQAMVRRRALRRLGSDGAPA
ncbi:hypothetical protein [Salininema proteolyticum]|uniref:DUF2178 domain-containing protein n=1 Tax=Salininema proteolyticum TaxID=1607685 RepID=A0ABV8U0M4_9ACTN